MTEPFWSKHARWRADRAHEAPGVVDELAREYRDAWSLGDREDKYAVIDFVRQERLVSGYDLIAETMRVDDELLAMHAVAAALSLLMDGAQLDPGVGAALEDFGRRYPNSRVLSDAALRRLNGDACEE